MTLTRGYPLVFLAALWGVVNFAYQPIANALVSDFSNPICIFYLPHIPRIHKQLHNFF